MMKLKYIYGTLSLLFFTQTVVGQIHSVVIGDTELVATYNVLDVIKQEYGEQCFDDSSKANIYFPLNFNASPFKWKVSGNNGAGLRNVEVYFAPTSTDTISSWRKFELFPKFVPGCNLFDTVRFT